ncbi:MAG: hypothetical protein NZZ41_01680 [Candidatus Dojkabacteria bacterium]|nr:hypothetical protein [Candidatus Dojkabacteria bacterium]
MKILYSILLKEGGKAAESVLNKLQQYYQGKELKVIKIPQNSLKIVFDKYIQPILDELIQNNFIEPSYKTDFSLGSTRLAAYIAGRSPRLLKSETPEIISKAIQTKKTFGDLDVDIKLKEGVSITDIGEYLEEKYPHLYAYRKVGNSEISLAVVMDDLSVIQIDLVDVSENEESIKFMQSSSIIDISEGVKGYAQKMLLASVLSVKKLLPEHKKIVDVFMKKHPDFQKAVKLGYSPILNHNQEIGRYSLSPNFEIYIVIDMKKPGVKTKKKLKTTDTPVFKFSNSEQLAKFIFPDIDYETLYSFVSLLNFIKTKFTKIELEAIKNSLIQRMDEQKSSLSPEDVEKIINITNRILG